GFWVTNSIMSPQCGQTACLGGMGVLLVSSYDRGPGLPGCAAARRQYEKKRKISLDRHFPRGLLWTLLFGALPPISSLFTERLDSHDAPRPSIGVGPPLGVHADRAAGG